MSRRAAVRVLVLVVFVAGVPGAAEAGPPVPEVAGVHPSLGAACVPESPYEARSWSGTVGPYGDACKRLRFSYGPIIVKPGQNDVLVGPVVIEKPAYPGYMVRFKPDLVDATGRAPSIDKVHLHHAAWASAYPQYGDSLQFMAAGEEKSIATIPYGYGLLVQPQDVWLMLYMVHSTNPQPTAVWIKYDLDFVERSAAEARGIKRVRPIWLDVQKERIHPDAPNTWGNPVFNVQRGFGSVDAETNMRVCAWPRQNCARHDVYGGVTPQQGRVISLAGADWRVPAGFAGTLVAIGGHLHPGGIRDEVSVVRSGVEKPIFISDAIAWDRTDPTRGGGPLTSWDFSMTLSGAELGWKVRIRQGDILRLNAVYDSEAASWYENMGIVVALVAPDDASGMDVFDPAVAIDRGVPAQAVRPESWPPAGWDPIGTCTPSATRLCIRGQVTHGHLAEASSFGGCRPACDPLPALDGPAVSDIVMGGFGYGVADQSTIAINGIPLARAGEPLTFWNFDTAADVWHTVTRCAEPCTGATGIAYPLADGGVGSPTDVMDFDSTEIGYGIFLSPASGQIGGSKPLVEAAQDGLFWSLTPTQTGTFTFWCRIHPMMRGAFKVV